MLFFTLNIEEKIAISILKKEIIMDLSESDLNAIIKAKIAMDWRCSKY